MSKRERFSCGHVKITGRNAKVLTECSSCRVLRWKIENPGRYREHRRSERNRFLLKKFGITIEQYETMLRLQGGVCAICGKPPKKVSLAVDHDHKYRGPDKSKSVRGLLCFRCNYGMRFYGDDPEIFSRAAAYLRGGEPAKSAATAK